MNKTPKLRFKEFSGNWEKAILGDRAYIKGRIGWKNLKQEEYTKKGPYLIAGKHIKNGIIDWDKCDHISIDRYNESPEIALKDDDIIFSKDGSLGNPAIIEDLKSEATINGTMMLVRLDNTFIYPKYFYYILNSRYFEKLINELKSGSSIPHIFQRDIVSFKFPITEIKEQEKIASFFSLIDDKISLQGEKVEALKDYKKGMMQKIFSRDLRFKDDDGRDYPEWEEKKLGECIDIITDYVAAGSFATIRENVQYKNYKDYAQLIRTVDLKSKFKNSSNFVYVDKNAFEFLYRVNLNKESIILPNVGNIGEVYFVKPENLPNENNVLAPNSILLRSTKNSNLFLYQLFNTKGFRDSLNVITSKSGQPKFNKTELKEIRLNIPTEQEQIKISKILDSIDSKIGKEQEKLDSLNEYKKGLLQQMFI